MFLTMRFRCSNPICSAHKWTPITITARRDGEHIINWMAYVKEQIRARHSLISPDCHGHTADFVIPMGSEERGTQAKHIGGATPDDDKFELSEDA